MLVNLKLDGKHIIVVGGGAEGYRKTLNFVNSGAKILIASKFFSSKVRNLQRRFKNVSLLETAVTDAEAFVKNLTTKPDLLVAVTDDHALNAQLVKYAKSAGCMVYAADNPSISDFMFPALAEMGEVQIAISTSGKSPAVARALRQKIAKMVTEKDLQQIKLQTYIRALLKQRISDQKTRKQILYKMLENVRVNQLLKDGKYGDAQRMAVELIEKGIMKPNGEKTSGKSNSHLREAEQT